MADEWGPWMRHDGKGCPVVGLSAMAETSHGLILIGVGQPRTRPGFVSLWHWCEIPPRHYHLRIVRYRVRRPLAPQKLVDLIENLPVTFEVQLA